MISYSNSYGHYRMFLSIVGVEVFFGQSQRGVLISHIKAIFIIDLEILATVY